jgi:DNA-binding MarR family transcriptional regulator
MPATKPKRELPIAGEGRRPDASLDADTTGLHEVLYDLKRVYQFRDRDRICCYDISVTQSWALEALERRGALTLNDLAGELYLDKSTASRVVDALERKGYVERTRHPDDGRALLIQATVAGSRLRGRIEHDILEQERRLLSEFEPKVRRSMVELIGRLAGAASAGLVSRGGKCCSIDSLEDS